MSVKHSKSQKKGSIYNKRASYTIYEYPSYLKNLNKQNEDLNNDQTENQSKQLLNSKWNKYYSHQTSKKNKIYNINVNGSNLISPSKVSQHIWHNKGNSFKRRFKDNSFSLCKWDIFSSKQSTDKWAFVAGGQTIYPQTRSNSKTAQKEGLLMPDKICNKDVPLHSLDIKILIPPSLVSDQLENTAQEERVDKWNESILPDLMNPIDTISNTSDSVINDRSAESIDDSGRFSLFHGSPYKEGLKKHISDYIKSKNAIKNSYMSTPNAN